MTSQGKEFKTMILQKQITYKTMKLHYLFLFVFLFSMCQNKSKTTPNENGKSKEKTQTVESDPNCKYKPNPIFKSEWEKVSNHSFERKGSKATEKVTFPNGVRLELFQTICNDTQQEYHFYLQGDFKNKPDEFWVAEAANQFFYMAGVGKEVQGISAWGIEIQNNPEKYILGEKIEIQDGISIKIDKLVGNQDSEVIITIAQNAD